jgi:SynChlorMet cassette protein ScmC
MPISEDDPYEMISLSKSRRIVFGPLRFQFTAHDAWAEVMLHRLGKKLECVDFSGLPHRYVHLLEFHPDSLERADGRLVRLPEKTARLLPRNLPREDWVLTGDDTGYACWSHPCSRHALWTFPTETPHAKADFQVPWQLLFEEIITRKGAMAHGGLATLNKKGFLFLAPPGGGKSTALSRLPPPWRVLGDDAALVWPNRRGGFSASPLPTWGDLLKPEENIGGGVRFKVGRNIDLDGIFLLVKSNCDESIALSPLKALPRIFRALNEHPRVYAVRHVFVSELIECANSLTKKTALWELKLTLSGRFWEIVSAVI